MKLTTKQNITFEEWLNQVKRFADYEYDIITATLPKDILTSTKAEIKLTIKSLIYPRFDGVVEYIQNWETFINVPTFDDNGDKIVDANGDDVLQAISQPQRKVVLSYKVKKSYEEIQGILDAVDPLIDINLVGKARLEAKVMKAIVLDVVGHHTFTTEAFPSGLPETEYNITL